MARISAFNRSCERKQSRIYPSKSLKKVAISFDHDPILFSTANPADEVFGRHRERHKFRVVSPRRAPQAFSSPLILKGKRHEKLAAVVLPNCGCHFGAHHATFYFLY